MAWTSTARNQGSNADASRSRGRSRQTITSASCTMSSASTRSPPIARRSAKHAQDGSQRAGRTRRRHPAVRARRVRAWCCSRALTNGAARTTGGSMFGGRSIGRRRTHRAVRRFSRAGACSQRHDGNIVCGARRASPREPSWSALRPGPAASYSSRKSRSLRERDGWRSLRSALASIWRIRSRVTLNSLPTSSSVRARPSSSP